MTRPMPSLFTAICLLFAVGLADRPVVLDRGLDCTALLAAYSGRYSRPHLVCIDATEVPTHEPEAD